ncbi:hypothetical protein DJ82_10335 [Halorubrum sp. Ib24]|uniref:DUF7261 family protein n=1 Tax=Halorubrum sp. Ib24 TaxID=1383850 RepID=UPI000B997F1B|nr:hypothetical protein [Halorubrum sp. Ib24]OYR38836.1 hypothetical protein DJ82_10335 [Halorubrum sp. Ib24]
MAAVIPGPSDGDGSRDGPRGDDSTGDGPRGDRRFRDADRGQLLLISGLVVAVSLVALVVLLNASIYSENVATRGIEAADGEALEVRAAAVEETGALIDGTNRNRPSDHDAAATAVEDGIADLDAYLARAYADRGGVTHVSGNRTTMENGSYVTGDLTANGTGDANATLAADVDRTRGFVVAVDPATLASTDAAGAPTDAFYVEFDDGVNETREVYVYNATDDNVTVAVGENGSDLTVVCSAPAADRVAVDLTGGTLGDERCPGLWTTSAGALGAPYDVTLERTDEANGTATATALPASGKSVSSDHNATPAVYEARIELRYRTADLRFETTVRVAPGEPDA